MRTKWTVLLVVLVLLAGAAAGFAAPKMRVVLYVNGTLGDKSFFDSANSGAAEGGQGAGSRDQGHRGRLRPGPVGARSHPAVRGRLGHHHRRHLAAAGDPGKAGAPQPEEEVHHLRHLGGLQQARAGQRLLHPVQAERGLVPGRRAGRHRDQLQDAPGQPPEGDRLPGRHGHPGDQRLQGRLRAGRQVHRPGREGAGVLRRRLQRLGQGQGADAGPVRPGRGHRLQRGRARRAWACWTRPRRRSATPSAWTPTSTCCSRTATRTRPPTSSPPC